MKELREDQVAYATGAVRSADRETVRYDLISPIGLRRVAEALHEGSTVKGYGDYNWEKGMPVADLLNHAIAHIYAFLAGDRSEDHLGHATWNLMGACHSEELWPHLNGNLRHGKCLPPGQAVNAELVKSYMAIVRSMDQMFGLNCSERQAEQIIQDVGLPVQLSENQGPKNTPMESRGYSSQPSREDCMNNSKPVVGDYLNGAADYHSNQDAARQAAARQAAMERDFHEAMADAVRNVAKSPGPEDHPCEF